MSTVDASVVPGARGDAARRLGAVGLNYGIVAAALLLFVVLSVSSDAFLTGENLRNILEQNAPVALVAIGTTPLLMARGIDLSLGATFGLSAIVAAKVANAADPVVGLLAGALVGVAIGLLNGVLCTRLRVNALIGTLASGIIIGGISLLITNGFAVSVSDAGFLRLGNDSLLGIGLAVWLFAVCAAVGQWVLSATTAGRKVRAAGGNPEAATLAGIRVERVLIAGFVISGVGAALGGLVVVSQVGTATPDLGGNSLMFTALTAVIVGGTSIMGGEGAIWRTLVGVLFLALINNGLNLLGVAPVYTSIVQGAVILVAIMVDGLGRRRGA